MTDASDTPSFRALIDAANQLFKAPTLATAEEAAELRAIIGRLLHPGRGSTMDFGDPANSGLLPGL
jgi:hypothetical protein